jgi:hypothetical protein
MRLLSLAEAALTVALGAAAASAHADAPIFSPRSDGAEVQSAPARISLTRRMPGAGDIEWRDRRASVVAESSTGPHRIYRFSTTSAALGRAERTVAEEQGQPYVRTGNTLFDGLFAMALADARLDEVAQIRDGAFDEGRPIVCVCFETGEKWPYVWTRDISYAVDLGLAGVDPKRALNSLLFKTSGIRAEVSNEQLRGVSVVAQDTGSGGSWPVSTDRVVWILAASDVIEQLPAAARPALARRLYRVARETVEQDRRFAFDAHEELYRGETSFLDWREQNYPAWTRDDVSSIAGGFAFSTNVLHVIALERTAQFAEQLRDPRAARYRRWSEDLRRAVNARFWQPQSGLYSSFLGAAPNSVPSASYDLLGLSLAVIHAIADEDRAHLILQHYPLSAAGPPVVWPEQSGIAVYHNRALWPFVTAYALRAAKKVRHAELAAELMQSLMRGSALSLSNMENFEFLTQQPRFEDGELSGPVINSPRQLWSVAAYIGMVENTLWGLELRHGRLTISPWLPGRLAHTLFAGQRAVTLHDFKAAGRSLNVTLELPREWPATGWLEPQSLSLNGRRLTGSIDLRRLRSAGRNEVRAALRAVAGVPQAIARIPGEDSRYLTPEQRRAVFAPPPVVLSAKRENAAVTLSWQGALPGATVQIYANGRQLAVGALGERFEDRAPRGAGTVCYALTQSFDDTGLASLPSRERCVGAVSSIGLTADDGSRNPVVEGVVQHPDWGFPSQQLRAEFVPPAAGWYRFVLEYSNPHGPINTGITAAVKTVSIQCAGGPEQSGSVVMPQTGDARWNLSTGFMFETAAGARCLLRVRDGVNMSYLDHFARYTGGQGGESGALNRADIAQARIDLIQESSP